MATTAKKLSYKIGEVSAITGLESYVLRFWETEFPSLRPPKSRGNQRVYTQHEIDLVLQIKRLLYEEKLTIPGARERLSHPNRKVKPSVSPGAANALPQGTTFMIYNVKKELESLLRFLRV